MGVVEKGWEWTCDWCGHIYIHDDGGELPDGWTQPKANGELEYFEHGVFCSEPCCVNYIKMDQLYGVLRTELYAAVPHHFKGKKTVPDSIEVAVLLQLWESDKAKNEPDYKPSVLEPPDRT
jgi:rubredoxin